MDGGATVWSGSLIETNLARAMRIAGARHLPLVHYLLSTPLAIGLLAMVIVLLLVVIHIRH